MRCRPLAKLVLLALADRCDEDGRGAWPALATIAAEAEVDDVRTVSARLRALAAAGLIVEQAPPRQRRPRTWALNLDALDRLARPLSESDPQPVAPLDPVENLLKESQGCNSAPPGVQKSALDPQPVAPDPVLLDPVHLNRAREVVRELVAKTSDRSAWMSVLDQAGQICRERGIPLGRPDEHVLERAYLIEHMRLKLARVNDPSPRRFERASHARMRS